MRSLPKRGKEEFFMKAIRFHFQKDNRHLHPLYFKKTFIRVLPVFFLPLVQALLRGASPSPSILGGSSALIVYFTLLWQQSRWRVLDDSYYFRSGLFLRKITVLPKRWAIHLQRETSPIGLLTGAVFFSARCTGFRKRMVPFVQTSCAESVSSS